MAGKSSGQKGAARGKSLERRIAEQEGAERAACDYISGMSDRYAVSLCEELLIPKFWQL